MVSVGFQWCLKVKYWFPVVSAGLQWSVLVSRGFSDLQWFPVVFGGLKCSLVVSDVFWWSSVASDALVSAGSSALKGSLEVFVSAGLW